MITRKLGRKVKNRKMMLRNLITSVILYERVITTEAKAKTAKGLIDKVINLGKKNTLDARRRLLGYLNDENAVKKIFEVLIGKYNNRNSGYTRTYRINSRLGDASRMMILELIDAKKTAENKKEAK